MATLKRCFVFTVTVRDASWELKEGDEVEVPVLASTKFKAERFFDDTYCGSEYPRYDIKTIREIGDKFPFVIKHL